MGTGRDYSSQVRAVMAFAARIMPEEEASNFNRSAGQQGALEGEPHIGNFVGLCCSFRCSPLLRKLLLLLLKNKNPIQYLNMIIR